MVSNKDVCVEKKYYSSSRIYLTVMFLALHDRCKLSNVYYRYVCYNLNDLFLTIQQCVKLVKSCLFLLRPKAGLFWHWFA